MSLKRRYRIEQSGEAVLARSGKGPVFIDIDGTLTTVPKRGWGPVIPERIKSVQAMIERGVEVVLWSGGGTAYARAFAKKYDLRPAACIGKPSQIVDDNPAIRPTGRIRMVAPGEFFQR